MIEDSLKYKISANDKKIKSLFRLKQKTNKKLSKKKINSKQIISKININQKSKKKDLSNSKEKQKINSFIINKENHKNIINLELSPILKTNQNNKDNNKDKSISFMKPYFNNSKKTNIKIKYKELECFINKKHPNNNISNSVSNNTSSNISKNLPSKIRQKKYISNSLTNNEKKRKRNISKSKTDLSYFDAPTPSTSFTQRKNFSKSFDFNLTYERFIENETKKKERISKLKKRREKYEKKIYPHQPKINEKSKNLAKSITDDFLERLEKYKKEQIEKAKNLKKKILKNEEDKINKNNYLLIQKKINKKRMNNSFDKINNNKTITESVTKLFDWDKKRKEKLEKEIKKQALIEKNIHIPKINKSKIFFKKDKIIQKIFDRLYNNNKYIFEFKKELLTEESTPKFNSLLNKTNSQSNISYNLKKIISSRSDFNKNVKEEEIIKRNKCDTVNSNNTNNDNNNDDEIKITNNTDRIIFNNNINEASFSKEQNSKAKSLIVVIRKVKSQIDILNKNK